MNIVFRADSNKSIGMGHIMRCLSIADEFKCCDNGIIFVLADQTVRDVVQNRGYEVIDLGSDYKDMDSELDYWPKIDTDVLIVDSYFVTASYLLALKNKTKKLVYIDDIYSLAYPVDILINYNAYGDFIDYDTLYKTAGIPKPVLLLGPTFAPLRTMFRGVEKKEQKKHVQDVLISTGGSDELHVALLTARYLVEKEYDQYIFHFLVGALNTDKEIIRQLVESRNNIILHENVTDMKALICSMDLAISAAGSTLYEICACGVPLITYVIADNQIPGAKAFEKLGLGVNIGDLRVYLKVESTQEISTCLDRDFPNKVIDELELLDDNYKRRIEMAGLMQRIIDGEGINRIVQKIKSELS